MLLLLAGSCLLVLMLVLMLLLLPLLLLLLLSMAKLVRGSQDPARGWMTFRFLFTCERRSKNPARGWMFVRVLSACAAGMARRPPQGAAFSCRCQPRRFALSADRCKGLGFGRGRFRHCCLDLPMLGVGLRLGPQLPSSLSLRLCRG